MKKQINFLNRKTTGTNKKSIIKKIFLVLMTIYALYQLGYGIGVFLAYIK